MQWTREAQRKWSAVRVGLCPVHGNRLDEAQVDKVRHLLKPHSARGLLRAQRPAVLGVTRRADAERDAAMRACGIEPILRSYLGTAGSHPYVVFCAAPGGNDEYAAEVKTALESWDSTAAGGARSTPGKGTSPMRFR